MEPDAQPAKLGDKFGESWTTHWFFVEFEVPDHWNQLAAPEDEFHFIFSCGCEAGLYDYETGKYFQAFNENRREYYVIEPRETGRIKFMIELACNGMFGNFKDGRGGMNPVDHHKMYTLSK